MIKTAANDTLRRQSWRINQAQDFLYVMRQGLITFPDTDWFVFFEDDAVCNQRGEDLTSKLLSSLRQYNGRKHNWHENFSPAFVRLHKGYGMVAQMFHREFLDGFVGYCSTRFHLAPVDWLLVLFLEHMGLKYEKAGVLNIFRHKGEQSSFGENDAREVDKRRRRIR